MPRRRAAYGLKAGTRYQSAGYGLEIGRIVRLFDGDVPRPLQPLVETGIEANRVLAMRGDSLMRNIAAGLFARGFNGPLRALILEGAVIQLLAVQAAAVTKSKAARPQRSLTSAERDAVLAARDLLLADMRAPPGLGEVALAVGLTEKRLNAGFRVLFSATAFEMLRNHRLELARIVLESGEATLKEGGLQPRFQLHQRLFGPLRRAAARASQASARGLRGQPQHTSIGSFAVTDRTDVAAHLLAFTMTGRERERACVSSANSVLYPY